MSIWEFIASDKHDITHLFAVEEFYQIDVMRKLNDWKHYKQYEKYGLPGFRYEMIHREQGFIDASDSLENVKLAIKHHIKRENEG
jgi:hypothetical protein